MILDDPSIDAVLFDAGGVLILPHPDGFRQALEPLGARPDDETCRRAHYEGMRECDRLGGPKWPIVDRVVARVAGVPEHLIDNAVDTIHLVYQEYPWVPAAGSSDCLAALAAGGVPVGVVSNASGEMEKMLCDLGVCVVDDGEIDVFRTGADDPGMPRVVCVIDSTVVGIEKPDPRIFHIALDRLRLSPDRCAYVGDTVTFDVAGAHTAGLRPFHLDPYELCPHDDHEHLSDLSELIGRSADPPAS